MPMETDHRTEDAVLWPATGQNDELGNPIVGDPIQIKVRWEWYRRDSLGRQTNPTSVDAMVVVDRDIPIGSRMWLGSLLDLPGTSFTPESYQCIVKMRGYIKDIKGRAVRRTVGLMRLHDEVP